MPRGTMDESSFKGPDLEDRKLLLRPPCLPLAARSPGSQGRKVASTKVDAGVSHPSVLWPSGAEMKRRP